MSDVDQLTRPAATPGHCPVARDETGAWVLSGHAEAVAAANDPAVFSSRASRRLNIPNGMDGEQHARYRSLVDRYLAPERVIRLAPCFRQIAVTLIRGLPRGEPVEAVGEIGARFAVRAQSAWLGWPAELEETLLGWLAENRAAARARDRERTAAAAERFDRIIRSLIETRRRAGAEAPPDVTTQLLGERVAGRRLSDEQIIVILRNWTAGDLGSIAACIGVVVQRLAVDRDLQDRWRNARPGRGRIEAGIDEILRIDDPFTFNRRLATTDVEVAGCPILGGDQVKLNWAAANRDPSVFGDPDDFRPRENAPHNLVYGSGPHACPGRALATLELRVITEELLAATGRIEPAPGLEPKRELPPYGGYLSLPILLGD